MLEIGDPLPSATVWSAPGEPVAVAELGEGRPALLLFYLFDWSST
jgi:hypothetical protein